MRTWLSKSKGYVSEMPVDSYSGVDSTKGEKIYTGDVIRISRTHYKYIGKITFEDMFKNRVSHERYLKEIHSLKNYEAITKRYTGAVIYKNGRYGIILNPETNKYHHFMEITRYMMHESFIPYAPKYEFELL